jgi:hypothetical protein
MFIVVLLVVAYRPRGFGRAALVLEEKQVAASGAVPGLNISDL